MIEAINQALGEEMERDGRVFLLGEDIGPRGGVFGATKGLIERFGSQRVLDTPIAESGFTGLAIGAALLGSVPVIEIQFADFIYSALEQIFSEMAKMHYRSNGDARLPIVVRAPIGGGIHGGFYHSQSPENLFVVPGLKVAMPATPADAKGMLKAAIRDPNPVIFFEHKRLYRSLREPVPESDVLVPLGVARIARPGTTLSVITYGATVHEAVKAAESLMAEGIDAEVLDLRSLQPYDTAAILATVAKTHRALVVHEASKTNGFGAELAAFIADQSFMELDAPVRRLAAPDAPAMPYNHLLESAYLVDAAKIGAAMRELAAF
ncbi:MAG: alpha-ketoacid dehydrogenase subunit beta [Thermomicrobia bacterium]|nr:alpha-ketoacid dehydrogenase subunit beta [Thermomicrobia bacterium]